jgi:hypothetical protein
LSDKTVEKLTAADPEIARRVPGNTVLELQRRVADLELPVAVPEDVRTQFDRSRRLYTYAYSDHALFSVAAQVAILTIEMALRVRLRQACPARLEELAKEKKATLGQMIEVAIEEGLLTEAEAERQSLRLPDPDSDPSKPPEWRSPVVNLRNIVGHGTELFDLGPNFSHAALEIAADVIGLLWRDEPASSSPPSMLRDNRNMGWQCFYPPVSRQVLQEHVAAFTLRDEVPTEVREGYRRCLVTYVASLDDYGLVAVAAEQAWLVIEMATRLRLQEHPKRAAEIRAKRVSLRGLLERAVADGLLSRQWPIHAICDRRNWFAHGNETATVTPPMALGTFETVTALVNELWG